jgi:hypothetical protein
MSERNTAIARRYFAELLAGNLALADEIVSEDVAFYGPDYWANRSRAARHSRTSSPTSARHSPTYASGSRMNSLMSPGWRRALPSPAPIAVSDRGSRPRGSPSPCPAPTSFALSTAGLLKFASFTIPSG